MGFITRYWKRILFALLGSFAAGAAVQKTRSTRSTQAIDTGPIVQELTLRQRFKKLIPKPKPSPKGSGNFGATPSTAPPHKPAKPFSKPEPEFPRPISASRDVAEKQKRSRDNKRSSLDRSDDFGLDRDFRRK